MGLTRVSVGCKQSWRLVCVAQKVASAWFMEVDQWWAGNGRKVKITRYTTEPNEQAHQHHLSWTGLHPRVVGHQHIKWGLFLLFPPVAAIVHIHPHQSVLCQNSVSFWLCLQRSYSILSLLASICRVSTLACKLYLLAPVLWSLLVVPYVFLLQAHCVGMLVLLDLCVYSFNHMIYLYISAFGHYYITCSLILCRLSHFVSSSTMKLRHEFLLLYSLYSQLISTIGIYSRYSTC